ncbi:unnamed protein product [Arabis nemorensis]|uniref:Endonuclease/exonuclease/phosphatase domain-containing protein n=1 Tax=Arabis nemorensis TaxID=586526 RepID=A0A565AYK2_9BRAS|nr:unnamed protein product [Arabis nemorensis]
MKNKLKKVVQESLAQTFVKKPLPDPHLSDSGPSTSDPKVLSPGQTGKGVPPADGKETPELISPLIQAVKVSENGSNVKVVEDESGINDPDKQQSFRRWWLKYKPTFGCLGETHVLEPNARRIIASILRGWRMEPNYEYSHIGKLWVVWDPAISLIVYNKSLQQITCGVEIPGISTSFTTTFTYASNIKAERRDLWKELQVIATNRYLVGSPWLVTGDFNQTLTASDHSLREEFDGLSAGSREFQHCLNVTGLFDLPYTGPVFTWWNHRRATPIAEKLDRILGNDQWLLSFPEAHASFEAPLFSDHAACCIRIPDSATTPKRPFKFNLHLLQHPDFLSIVEEAWRGFEVEGSPMKQVSRKLKLLKRILKELDHSAYSNIQKRTAETLAQLQQSQNAMLSDPSRGGRESSFGP